MSRPPIRITPADAIALLRVIVLAVAIILTNIQSGVRITTGTTTKDAPETAGQIRRTWQAGELVAGTRYAVESTVDGRTYPGPDEEALVVEIFARRTT